MTRLDASADFCPHTSVSRPVFICLLGHFRVLQAGLPITLYNGGQIEALLSHLALQHGRRVPREKILSLLWPDQESRQAGRSLNSLIYRLNKLLEPALGGAASVLYMDGYYRLNMEAGVGVDVDCFDDLVRLGDQQLRAHDLAAAAASYSHALALYRGDLSVATDINAVVERERLRSCHLALLAHLADYHYHGQDYAACLEYAWRLLSHDPCREDAHRMVMRCYVRRGHRAEALRHYQVCLDILRAEFGAVPEVATTALFDQIRLQPDSI